MALCDDVLVVYSSEVELGVASKHALKSRYFETLELINGAGSAFRIAAFERVREPFWKRPRTPFGRGIRLRNFEFLENPAPLLGEVRDRMKKIVSSQRAIWDARGDTDTLLARIESASGFADLIEAVSGITRTER